MPSTDKLKNAISQKSQRVTIPKPTTKGFKPISALKVFRESPLPVQVGRAGTEPQLHFMENMLLVMTLKTCPFLCPLGTFGTRLCQWEAQLDTVRRERQPHTHKPSRKFPFYRAEAIRRLFKVISWPLGSPTSQRSPRSTEPAVRARSSSLITNYQDLIAKSWHECQKLQA